MKCAAHAALATTTDMGALGTGATYVRTVTDEAGTRVRIWKCNVCGKAFARPIPSWDTGETTAAR